MLTERKLGDLIRIKHGFPFLGEHFTDSGEFIVLTPGNFFESGGFKHTPGKEKYYDGNFPQEYLCAEGDLIVAMTQQAEGLLGSTALVPESGVYLHNQRIGLVSLDNKLADKLYVYYLFMTDLIRRQIRSTATGSKVKHTSPERIYDVSAWTPDVPMQQSIGKTLHMIDRKIALNNAINAELEITARLLYDYWFTQFDFPDANGKPYKSSSGEMVWNEQLKRKIPRAWKFGVLSDIAYVIPGQSPNGSSYNNDGEGSVFYQGAAEFGFRFPQRDKYTTQPTRIAEKGDVLFSVRAPVGKINIANERCCIGRGLAAIRSKDGNQSFVVYTAYMLQKRLATMSGTGTTFGSIDKDTLSDLKVVIPPDPIIAGFNNLVSRMDLMIEKNFNEVCELIDLRDFLLPLLMNGQVIVATVGVAASETIVDEPVVEDKQAKRATVFKRLVLSAYILDNICDEPTAGRVKFEKLLYLSEHCAQLPLHSQFQRAAAGPYDSQALYGIESQLKKNKWFKRQNKKGESRAYARLTNSNGYEQYLGSNLDAEEKTVIDRLLKLLKTVRTTQCEIIATLYSAWNDFIIDGAQPSDDQIVDEVLTNWHESKERIDRSRWLVALGWMRENDIVPTGYGVHTKR